MIMVDLEGGAENAPSTSQDAFERVQLVGLTTRYDKYF